MNEQLLQASNSKRKKNDADKNRFEAQLASKVFSLESPISSNQLYEMHQNYMEDESQKQMEEQKIKISILKEPQNLIQIQSIDEDIEIYKKDPSRLQQKPVDTYLNHCQIYSQNNMNKKDIEIKKYEFGKKDFSSGVLNQTVFQIFLKKQGVQHSQIKDKDMPKFFVVEPLKIKVFIDFLFNGKQQFLLVKTWQKVTLQNPFFQSNNLNVQEKIQPRKLSIAPSGSYNNLLSQGQNQQANSDTSFYIKTFQIFDKKGKQVGDQVLVEQVFGEFDKSKDIKLYDTSILSHQSKLYYFKRMYETNVNQEFLQPDDNIEFLKQKQVLQLHSYDYGTKKEQLIQNIKIEERLLYNSQDDQNFSKIDKDISLYDLLSKKPQFNILMSMRFGPSQPQNYENEMAWLKEQYFSIQQYIQDQETKTIRIFRMDEFQNMNLKDCQITKISENSGSSDIEDCIKQVQYLNHIKHSSKKEEKSHVTFVITNIALQVLIQYDPETNQSQSPKPQWRKPTDQFQRIWNNGGIVVQKQSIVQDGSSQKEEYDQFYYIDSRNQIQLLYPLNYTKVEKLKLVEIIGMKNKVSSQDFNQFKKITCINHSTNGEVQYSNTIQKIEHLKKILVDQNYVKSQKVNRKSAKIDSSQSFTYLKDSISDVLLASSPSSNKITLYYLLDKNVNQCDILHGPQNTDLSQRQSNYAQQIEVSNNGPQQLSRNFNDQIQILNTDNDKKNQAVNLILINNFNGHEIKVKTHEIIQQEEEQEQNIQQLKLVVCQQSQGNEFMLFIFEVLNSFQQGQSIDSYNDSRINKKSYIFVRKSASEMNEIIDSMCTLPLIGDEDTVKILINYSMLGDIKFNEIYEYQFYKEKDENNEIDFNESQKKIFDKFVPFQEIKLLLNKESVEICKLNFVLMVYQQKQASEKIKLMVYDVKLNKITEYISISPSLINQDYMYEDGQGYKKFLICRTSSLHEEINQNSPQEDLVQRVKYQLFTLYQEKVGRIMCEEFLIVHEKSGARIQTIGQKHIILSQQVIQECEWTHIADSQVVPFINLGQIKGCQLFLKTKQDSCACINLQDQDINNIYSYKSNILNAGNKKFMLSKEKPEQFAMVVSSQMRSKIIVKNLFDRSESFFIFQKSLELILTMRIPDLDLLILNRFDDLKIQDFFQSQEILLGKSICDICLSEPDSINKAIKEYNYENNQKSEGSVIENIIMNDQVRKQTFIQTKFYPKQLILQIDLNLVGTVRRAIEFSNYKSLKILLLQVLDVIDSMDYQPLIMFDLPTIMDSKQIQVNDFFNISKTEKKDAESGFCNLEIEFRDPDLPVFHDKPFDFFNIKNFENFLQYERDILNKIQELNQENTNEKTHEIEYYYIDFTQLIIGEKMRNLNSKETIKFNDLYYAKLMKIKSEGGDSSNSFFAQETIQKIIDSQWRLTKYLQQKIFSIYLLFYCVPMCVSSFKISNATDDMMFEIALFPACMLTFIEVVQFMEQGAQYFSGWNIVDSIQIFIYGLLFCMRIYGIDNQVLFFPELKLLNIILAFMKILFFIRIYEKFGFLVQMILSCVYELIPFIISYIVFLLLFSVCFVVLEMEIDPEVDEAKGLTYFQKTVLQTFRTAIGELGMPKYEKISEKDDSIFKDINIYLIWLVWFIQTFFMLVIMLNFLIAVITSNYEQTMIQQKLIGFRHKAEMNYEIYMLVKIFKKMDEYKCIVFQCSKSNEGYNEDEFDEKFDSLKKFINRENKRVMQEYLKLNENIQFVKDQQQSIDKQVHQKFNSLHSLQKEIKDELLDQFQNIKNIITNNQN